MLQCVVFSFMTLYILLGRSKLEAAEISDFERMSENG